MIGKIRIQLAKHSSESGDPIKGIGEASTTGVPPAVIRALEKNLGRRLRRTPVRAEEILAVDQNVIPTGHNDCVSAIEMVKPH